MSDSVKHYYTYIVRCSDGTFYTGFTTDPEHRVAVHNSGRGAKYTRSRRPVELVWSHAWKTEHEARHMEVKIKQLSREEKEALVAGGPVRYE
jgi:putative endonuclease